MIPIVGPDTAIRNNRLWSILLLILTPLSLPIVLFLGVLVLSHNPNFAATLALLGAGLFVLVVIAKYFSVQRYIDSSTNARTVGREELSQLRRSVEYLARKAGLSPIPEVRIIDIDDINAYASGVDKSHTVVTVTRGLVNYLDDSELQAVLAHEITHILNEDTRFMTVAVVCTDGIWHTGGLIDKGTDALSRGYRRLGGAFVKDWRILVWNLVMFLYFAVGRAISGVFHLTAYVNSLICNRAASRSREYMADFGGIELTNNPHAMINALAKVGQAADIHCDAGSVRQMLFYNPVRNLVDRLLSTHPSIENRIQFIRDHYNI